MKHFWHSAFEECIIDLLVSLIHKSLY